MVQYYDILKALILGIIEGLTEFLPISSTGHLILATNLIDFSRINNGVFETSIQIGAIFAVITYYRKRIFDIIFNINNKSNLKFCSNIFISFLPSAIFGLLFYKAIKNNFFNEEIVICSLFFGGIVMILFEYYIKKTNFKFQHHNIDDINYKIALKLGLFQLLAMIPGMSRSGATIMGALFLRFDRRLAVEYSFYLAIPTILAASLFDIVKNINILNSNDLILIFFGALSSFISSLFVIKWLLNFITKNNFIIFGFYRIIISLLMFLILVY